MEWVVTGLVFVFGWLFVYATGIGKRLGQLENLLRVIVQRNGLETRGWTPEELDRILGPIETPERRPQEPHPRPGRTPER